LNEKVEGLLNQVTHDSSDLTAKELAEIEDVVPFLIDIFPSLTAVQKMAVIQVGLYKSDKNLMKFIEDVVNSNELFFIKEVAEGVLEVHQRKNNEKYVKTIVNRFNGQPDEKKITDLALIGHISSIEVLPFLEALTSNNKDVIEQKNIAKLQIKKGIKGLVEEYKTREQGFSTRGLREALYHSFPNEEVVSVIVEDLFKDDRETLMDTTTIILYEPMFPKEVIDQKVVDRLLSIIEGDHANQIKENALNILRRVMKKNKLIKADLERIYQTKSYMKKKNVIQILKSKELTNLFRDIFKK
jgi:hypothetical protein